jgi:hypothetical protein
MRVGVIANPSVFVRVEYGGGRCVFDIDRRANGDLPR